MIELDDSIDTVKIYRHTAHAIPFAPWPLPTDTCILRVVNACPALDRCSRSRLIGYGLSGESSAKISKTISVHIQPENRWPWLFESYENRLWCDVVAVLKPNISLEVYMQDNQIYIFAEHVSLDELTVRNELAAGVNTNVWIQAKNLTISKRLFVESRLGGVVIDQLVMPTSAYASVSISEGSVDILTPIAPRLVVKSQNQAVCIVGEYENMTTSPIPDSAQTNNTLEYALRFRCFEELDCQQPLWEISCLGLHGSIGVHSNSKAAALNGSEPPMIYAGSGFKPAEGTQSNRFFFTHVNHEKITNDIYEYAVIRITGLGMMNGGVQSIWSSKKIWFFWGGELTWFATSSLFVVMPTITEYQATISFCPAHGHGQIKDLSTPLMKIMDSAEKGGSRGYWAFRNVGGLRDSMQPLQASSNMNRVDSYDSFIPDCKYCADYRFWKAAFYVGSLCENTLPEPYVRAVGCRYSSCQRNNAATLSMLRTVTSKCFPNEVIAPLMSNEVTFGDNVCVAPADKACQMHEGSDLVPSVYFDQIAEIMVYISVCIGALSASVVLYICSTAYKVAVSKHTIDEMMNYQTGDGEQTFQIVQEAISLSRLFCLAHRRKHRTFHSRTQSKERDTAKIVPDDGSNVVRDPVTIPVSEHEWIREDLIRLDKKKNLGKHIWRSHDMLDPVPIVYFASEKFAERCNELVELQENLSMMYENSPSHYRYWVARMLLHYFNLFQSYLKILTHRPHIYLHHHLEYRMELKLDVYFEKTLNGELELSERDADSTSLQNFCVDNKDWKAGLQNVVVKFEKDSDTGRGSKSETVAAADIYDKMIVAVQKAHKSLEEFQADVTIWYFLEKYMNFGKSHFETEAKEKGSLKGKPLLSQVHSVQELKHIIMHVIFIMTPCWLIYLFCIVMFATRIKERGVADFGKTGLFTTNFLQDLGKYSTLLIVVTNFVSAYRHKLRENLRLHKAEKRSKLEVYHRLNGRRISINGGQVSNGQGPDNIKDLSAKISNHTVHAATFTVRFMNWLSETVHDIMQDLWLLEIGCTTFYMVVVAIWVLLGMFLSPVVVAPFATAISGLALHIIVIYSKLNNFFQEAKLELKGAMQQFKVTAIKQVLQQNTLESGDADAERKRLESLMKRLNIDLEQGDENLDEGQEEMSESGIEEWNSKNELASNGTMNWISRIPSGQDHKVQKIPPSSGRISKSAEKVSEVLNIIFATPKFDQQNEELKSLVFQDEDINSNINRYMPKFLKMLFQSHIEPADTESLDLDALYWDTYHILEKAMSKSSANFGSMHMHIVVCKVLITLIARHDIGICSWLKHKHYKKEIVELSHHFHSILIHKRHTALSREVHQALKTIKFRELYIARSKLKEKQRWNSTTAKQVDEIFSALADKSYWDGVPFCQPESEQLSKALKEHSSSRVLNNRAQLLQKIHESTVQDREVLDLLAKHGISMKGIIAAMIANILILVLIFIFLFVGMIAFSPKVPDSWQSALNSFMVALAALGTNISSSSGLGGGLNLRLLIDKINLPQHYAQDHSNLIYDLDEDVDKVLQRAADLKRGVRA
eukprot:CAMPEP_0172159236 /NCGR_PEP_ID=MMETSP1050-20130122/4849_1 /TAXON_ID=233186 /ORGANISM="Cryptomonas curvata, Strain CCAP979/52" /LENGTH=1554 /DNA_ID=CAMNT_0012828783 /DNA_START=129 /DNA_END=4793 /DNA_ORIENTATION=+